MHYFELRHSGIIPLCPWQIFVRGCFCWALPLLLFALLFCWMAKRISGWGICVSPLVWLFLCLFFVIDLPCYMTTGVNVDFISNCFFTCKDRALERDRPYQRKKMPSPWHRPATVHPQAAMRCQHRAPACSKACLHGSFWRGDWPGRP